ncbi:MAG: iron-containing alcohol dehydrogenase [Deltaproteobacteria bacterium]|nr:iron-containing alcohol dehydrogenase [Deltaproteobacteria bacterium]
MSKHPEPRVAIPTYGRDLLRGLPPELLRRPIVLTQPEPWALVSAGFPADRTRLHRVETMEQAVVDGVTAGLGDGSAVFGIGGGSALDHAKYVAWKRGLPLVLVPTILSVDAAYTKAIGVREGGRVRYVGAVYPDHLLIDYGLLQAADPILNRAGVGDILSIFTAIWDWREAGARLGEPYDAGVAAESRALLDRLFEGAAGIGCCSDAGLHLLSELYVGEVRLCELVGNARPEEGSEHYVAYCLEHRTGRHYLHGALVGMGVLLAGAYQGQDVGPVKRFLSDVRLDSSYRAVGTTADEVRSCLLGMGDYVAHESQLLPGVFHFRGGISAADAGAVMAAADLGE